MQPVKKQPATEQATDILRAQLTGGAFKPGEAITEISLAEKLNVARGTVRTALSHLTQEGLVVKEPYKGWTVCGFSSHDAWELYTLRAALEALAAKLTAANLTEVGKEQLQRMMAKLSQRSYEGAASEAAALDAELHELIVSLSGHRLLQEQYRIVRQRVRLCIKWSDAIVVTPSELVTQHEPIVNALISGNGDLAAELSSKHNEKEGNILVEHLMKLELKIQ